MPAETIYFDKSQSNLSAIEGLVRTAIADKLTSTDPNSIVINQPEEYTPTSGDQELFPLGLNTVVLVTNKTGFDVLKRPVKVIYHRISVDELIASRSPTATLQIPKETEFTEGNILSFVASQLGIDNFPEMIHVHVDGEIATANIDADMDGTNYVFVGSSKVTVEKAK